MTNNYLKIFHYRPAGIKSRMDVQETFIFFDDNDPEDVEAAVSAARETVRLLTYRVLGRRIHFSVYRCLPRHSDIPEVGDMGAVIATRPAA